MRRFLSTILCLAALLAPASALPADVVMRNGAVYTVNPRQPWAQAVAVSHGRIVYVGTNEGARPFVGQGTRVIDLHGRMVLPGFHDEHVHLVEGSLDLGRCNLTGCKTVAEVAARVRAYAKKHPELKWITGGGWDMALFPQGNPSRQLLDELVPDRPAVLWASDGHNGWANTRALEAANITAATKDPPHGRIERDASGNPSGTLREEADDIMFKAMPEASEDEMMAALLRGQRIAHRYGITSTQEALAPPAVLRAWRTADARGKLQLRVTACLPTDPDKGPEQVDDLVKERAVKTGPYLRVTGAKIFADGVIETHTAALLAPYADDSRQRGPMNFTPAALAALVTRLDKVGFQVHVHAIGDRAVRTTLDAFAAARKANGRSDHRHHIAHMQLIDPADFGRFLPLGVTANFQAFWMQVDVDAAEDTRLLGKARYDRLYPIASVMRTGARVVGGSDWKVSSMNPLDAIEVAVTHLPLGATSGRPHVADQRIPLARAIEMYTRNAAWLNFEENIAGSIERGKAADLIVLDRNLFRIPPRQIHAARVVLTMFDGRIVYQP